MSEAGVPVGVIGVGALGRQHARVWASVAGARLVGVHDTDAARAEEVSVGAILVEGASGQVLGAAHNRVEALHDPTAHAELLVIQEATRRLGLKRLTEAVLYVTLEPCPMCAQAIAFARLRSLTFGAFDPKGGGVAHGPRIFEQPTCHHRPTVTGGLQEARSTGLLKAFFQARR